MKNKEEVLGIDVPLAKDHSWHFPAKALALFVVVGALLWAGGEIRPANTKLPANEACLKASEEVPLYYQAKIAEIFEQPLTQEVPSKQQIDALLTNCQTSVDVYTITTKEK